MMNVLGELTGSCDPTSALYPDIHFQINNIVFGLHGGAEIDLLDRLAILQCDDALQALSGRLPAEHIHRFATFHRAMRLWHAKEAPSALSALQLGDEPCAAANDAPFVHPSPQC
jgi:hypothetical protein